MYSDIPHAIRSKLQGEPVDFIVHSARDYRLQKAGKAILVILACLSWLVIFPIMFTIPLFEIFLTGSTQMTVNGVEETYTSLNMTMPIVFALVPLLVTLIAGFPVYFLIRKAVRFMKMLGPWYAGTNNHLIEMTEDSTRYFPWKDFHSEITTKHHGAHNLDIILQYNQELHEKNAQEDRALDAIHIKVNGKPVDLKELFSLEQFGKNKIGILGIPHGDHILRMIRHNMR